MSNPIAKKKAAGDFPRLTVAARSLTPSTREETRERALIRSAQRIKTIRLQS